MLTLPIKKKWFDMILSGEKKEEYREIKPYYDARLLKLFGCIWIENELRGGSLQRVAFRNGYRKNAPTVIVDCELRAGEGKTEWGAEKGKKYYILQIKQYLEV